MLEKVKWPSVFRLKRVSLVFSVCLIIIFVWLWFKKESEVIFVDLYGTSTDANIIRYENALLSLKDKLKKDVVLHFYYVASKQEDGTLASIQAQLPDSTPDILAYDLAENKQRMALQKYFPEVFPSYLRFYNSLAKRPSSGTILEYLGVDDSKFADYLQKEGNNLIAEGWDNVLKIKNAENFSNLYFPILVINGKVFKGEGADILDIASEIAKIKLRRGGSELGEKNDLEILGGVIKIGRPARFSYKGLYECYRDNECNDRVDDEGWCEGAGTKKAHCAYQAAPSIPLTIVADLKQYKMEEDEVVKIFGMDNKKLAPKLADRYSMEGRKIAAEFGIKVFPAYYFDRGIENSRLFTSYLDNKILIKSGDYYVFNSEVMKNGK